MGIGAGGHISQSICKDNGSADAWHKEALVVFNVQMLNAAVFKNVTGLQPPASPINAATYAQYGFPFFKLVDEKPSGIGGGFENVKSVNEIDGKVDENLEFPLVHMDQLGHHIHPESVTVKGEENVWKSTATGDILNPLGPMSEFRSVKELEEELSSLNFVD